MTEISEAVSNSQKTKTLTNIMKTNHKGGWHVLYVKSRHEKKVHKQLIDSNLRAYLPLVERERKWSDRTKKVVEPLFKSYVFVYTETAMDFHKALSVHGACAYIRFGKDYAIVKNEEIEKIKFLVSTEGIEDITVAGEVLSVGESKIITNGTLKGLECEVIEIKGKNLVTVRLGSLRQNLRATISSAYLSSLSKAM